MHPPIEIIDRQNICLYQDVLEDLWRMRCRVAKRFNWSIPYLAEGLDKDEFDRDDTIYLVILNDDRRVVGCSRLIPSIEPHLLDTVFGDYCDLKPIPRSKNIWEFSRMFVDRDYVNLVSVVKSCYLLMSGVAELSVAHGLDGVTWYTSMPNYQAALACWRQTFPIGRPALHKPDNVIYVPAFSPIDSDGLVRIKERARHEGPVTQYIHRDGVRSLGEEVNVFENAKEVRHNAA
ncbi:MAG: acyl-homoserine-lactone synthase [Pseudomonadota bacterium]